MEAIVEQRSETAINFTGTETANVDSKGRVLLSAQKRKILGHNFVIQHGPLGCLVVYPKKVFDAMIAEIDNYGDLNEGADAYRRLVAGSSSDGFNCDEPGRVSLPLKLRTLANITDTVTIVGLGRKFEIWATKEYETYEQDIQNYGLERLNQFKRARDLMLSIAKSKE